MRVVKHAEERRHEILDAADELFAQKGYDGTSTNDIIEKVGIARGTLYHHFKSKEHIMDALIERYSARLLSAAREIAADESIPVVERLIQAVMAMSLSGGSGSGEEILDHIHKPNNALLHQKIQKLIIQEVPPILTDIIRDGIDQGLFHTPFPYECMEMIVVYAHTVFDHDGVIMTDEERTSRLHALIYHVERLLGAESGTLVEMLKMFTT